MIHDTLWLYLRMGVLTLVQLAVMRLLLAHMGFEGYGVWAVALSMVLIWSFPADIAGEVTLRWLSVNIGAGVSETGLHHIFFKLRHRASIVIFLSSLICLFVGILWIRVVAAIPDDVLVEAEILVAVLTLMMCIKCYSVQYMSWLVSRQRFKEYAWLSIAEGLATLLFAGMLALLPHDNMAVAYACALVMVETAVLIAYRKVCGIKGRRNRQAEATPMSPDVSGAGKYMLWNAIGGLTVIIWLQGLTPLMNSLYGLMATAGVSVAMMLLAKVRGFCAGFERAVVPRLMKLHAAGEYAAVRRLLLRYAAVCIILLGLLLGALAATAGHWLAWWLGDVPEYCVTLTRIALMAAWICSIDVPLNAVVHARGRIKAYELTEGSLILGIPLAVILAAWWGCDAPEAFAWQLVPLALTLPFRLAFALRALRE